MKHTAAERKRAADNALADAVIEGFQPDEEFTKLWNQLVNDEITSEEYHAIVTARALEEDRQAQQRKAQQQLAA